MAMDFEVRHIREDEWQLLEDFLYEAIYVPEGFGGEVPRSVIYDDPKCRAAFEGFGALPDDRAMVAVSNGKVVGACWARTTDEYGHIDEVTPSLSISLYRPYRSQGIGGAMMRALIDELRVAGYPRCSLSVQKENPALRLYKRMGFRIVGNGVDDSEWLMVADLALTRIRTADVRDAETVHAIAQQTIRKIYPSSYEPAIVEAFCRLHSVEAIASDISNARVFLLEDDGRPIGTGTLDGCHVTRVFVLPDFQGHGWGTAIMDALEALASRRHRIAVIDSSKPAERFYGRRGYHVTGDGTWDIAPEETYPAATLTYKIMEKRLS